MLINQDKYRVFGYKVPTYFWFVLSGGLCDIIQALIDYCIFLVYVLKWERTTVCWTLSYTLSIVVRHYSHRLLVFGEFEGSYCSSLTRTYLTYSSSIVISAITNHLMVTLLDLEHRTAWIVTMLWTGIYNYFMLKNSWRGGKTPSGGGSNEKGSSSGAASPPTVQQSDIAGVSADVEAQNNPSSIEKFS